MKLRLFMAVAAISLLASNVFADCVNPAGKEGQQVYNGSYHVMQFCNGTNWIAMAGVSTNVTGESDTLSGLNCTTDQIVKFDGTNWVCASQSAGGVSNCVIADYYTAYSGCGGTVPSCPAGTVYVETQSSSTSCGPYSTSSRRSHCYQVTCS